MRSAVRLICHLPRAREAGRFMKDERFVTENSQWDFSIPLFLRCRHARAATSLAASLSPPSVGVSETL